MRTLASAIAIILTTASAVAGSIYWQVQQDVVLADYEQTKQEIMYLRCLNECEEICRANGVTNCSCEHCKRYLR